MSTADLDSITGVLMRETEIIFTGHPVKITPNAPLASLGFDSMSFVELLVSVEKKFGVKLMELGMSQDDLKSLETLARRIQQVL